MFFNRRIPSFMREAYYYDSLGAVFGILSVIYFGRIKVQKNDAKQKRKKRGVLPKEILEVFKKDRPFALFQTIFSNQGFANLMIMPLFPNFSNYLPSLSSSTLNHRG